MRKSGYCSSLFTPVNLSVWLDWQSIIHPPPPLSNLISCSKSIPSFQQLFLDMFCCNLIHHRIIPLSSLLLTMHNQVLFVFLAKSAKYFCAACPFPNKHEKY